MPNSGVFTLTIFLYIPGKNYSLVTHSAGGSLAGSRAVRVGQFRSCLRLSQYFPEEWLFFFHGRYDFAWQVCIVSARARNRPIIAG
jgi:hypothetical protein